MTALNQCRSLLDSTVLRTVPHKYPGFLSISPPGEALGLQVSRNEQRASEMHGHLPPKGTTPAPSIDLNRMRMCRRVSIKPRTISELQAFIRLRPA
jgi:hypothetical protein